MEIEGRPTTVGGLIEAAVRCVVADFNDKANRADSDTEKDVRQKALTKTDIADLAETRRIAFGIMYNGKQVDAHEAVANALQGYADGAFDPDWFHEVYKMLGKKRFDTVYAAKYMSEGNRHATVN